jgi:hypothetical protein
VSVVLHPEVTLENEGERFSYDDFKGMDLLDDHGRIRLLAARRYFNENENYFPLLPQLFDAWKNEHEYMVLKHVFHEKESFFAVKCAKRGNDVYNSRIKRRFGFLRKNVNDFEFFSVNDFRVDHVVKTRALWVTLTWHTRKGSIRQAWEKDVSKAWNRWISAMRKRYGRIDVLRAWETTERGYPDTHAILLFESKEWTVFPWLDKHEKLTYRIQEKDEIHDLWRQGFIDVQALRTMRSVVNYALKYQMKVNEGREDGRCNQKTLAFMWLYRKRSYAVSRRFFSVVARLDRDLHNSNPSGIENDGTFEFLGVFSGRLLGLTHGEWYAELKPDVLTGLIKDGDPDVDQGISRFED